MVLSVLTVGVSLATPEFSVLTVPEDHLFPTLGTLLFFLPLELPG